MLPGPVPPAAESVTHAAPLAADHVQDGSLGDTLNVPGPPTAPTEIEGGVTENVHTGAGAPSSVTVNVWPAIVAVPLRLSRAVLGATVNWTGPSPWPEPVLSVNHGAFEPAAHVHPSPFAFTETEPLPPDDPIDCDVGLIVNEQPRWVTVSTCPAIDAFAVRSPPVFGATPSVTDPPPDPSLRTDAIVSQSFDDAAFQPHAAPVARVTETLILPPLTGAVWLVGLIVKLHDAAAWVTVNVRSATVTVPLRGPLEFAATRYAIDPLPLPDAAPDSVIHALFACADQAHPVVVVTAIDPVVPLEPTDASEGASE
jgi:hypothetical protein